MLTHRFVIAPNEQARETPYIAHNISATRKAFALDTVAVSLEWCVLQSDSR